MAKTLDKGAFDAVSRATTNHGLHRGSYQCDTVIYGEDGSGDKYLDVVANGVSKGKGMLDMAKKIGIEQNKIIAVGDNMNDISMLEVAGISYAVENAEESVKKIADNLAPSNNGGAIAYIINRLEKIVKTQN